MRAKTATLVLAVLGLAVPSTVVATMPSATENPTAPRGLIAYELLTGGVFTIRANGTDIREIVSDGHNPAWSPDGRRLLYERNYGAGGIWWARPDGTDAHLIIPGVGPGRPPDSCDRWFGSTDAAWDRSGQRIAFVGHSSEGEENPVNEICTASTDGSSVRGLHKGSQPDWFPDGRHIAFITAKSSRNFSNRIARMRDDGRGVRMLVDDTKSYRSHPDVSPDGRRLAFLESNHDFSGSNAPPEVVRVMDLRTGRTRTIPWRKTMAPRRRLARINAAVWTPAGNRIMYLVTDIGVGERVRPSRVYTIRPDGSGRTRLFTLPFADGGLWAESLSVQPPQDPEM